jgi:two-component system chemotaxis sensor kinase CheA
MAVGPTAADLLAALAAAVVEADPGDPAAVHEVAQALLRAGEAGALSSGLAAEAGAIATALEESVDPAPSLSRLSALLADEGRAKPSEAPAPTAMSAQRDSETIELIGDFLEESGEGLARADEMLLAVEKSGPEADKVHALFRVFHTIKGVAGFLELTEVVSLAHTTENLLNLVREGRM